MKLFGIIGYPLGHSFSQKHFTDKFDRDQLADHCYRKFELPDISLLPSLIESEPELRGFNVTIPYKVQVMDYLDEIDETATGIGASKYRQGNKERGQTFPEGVQYRCTRLQGITAEKSDYTS